MVKMSPPGTMSVSDIETALKDIKRLEATLSYALPRGDTPLSPSRDTGSMDDERLLARLEQRRAERQLEEARRRSAAIESFDAFDYEHLTQPSVPVSGQTFPALLHSDEASIPQQSSLSIKQLAAEARIAGGAAIRAAQLLANRMVEAGTPAPVNASQTRYVSHSAPLNGAAAATSTQNPAASAIVATLPVVSPERAANSARLAPTSWVAPSPIPSPAVANQPLPHLKASLALGTVPASAQLSLPASTSTSVSDSAPSLAPISLSAPIIAPTPAVNRPDSVPASPTSVSATAPVAVSANSTRASPSSIVPPSVRGSAISTRLVQQGTHFPSSDILPDSYMMQQSSLPANTADSSWPTDAGHSTTHLLSVTTPHQLPATVVVARFAVVSYAGLLLIIVALVIGLCCMRVARALGRSSHPAKATACEDEGSQPEGCRSSSCVVGGMSSCGGGGAGEDLEAGFCTPTSCVMDGIRAAPRSEMESSGAIAAPSALPPTATQLPLRPPPGHGDQPEHVVGLLRSGKPHLSFSESQTVANFLLRQKDLMILCGDSPCDNQQGAPAPSRRHPQSL